MIRPPSSRRPDLLPPPAPRAAAPVLILTQRCSGTDDPQDAQVARQYLSTPEEFAATAKFWTETYARDASELESEEKHPALQRLLDMGFPEADCRQALLDHKGEENAAIEQLLANLG